MGLSRTRGRAAVRAAVAGLLGIALAWTWGGALAARSLRATGNIASVGVPVDQTALMAVGSLVGAAAAEAMKQAGLSMQEQAAAVPSPAFTAPQAVYSVGSTVPQVSPDAVETTPQQPGIAYGADGTPYIVMPAAASGSADMGDYVAPQPQNLEPRVQASGAAAGLRYLHELKKEKAQAPAPQLVIVPIQTPVMPPPTQIAAAAAPAPFVPTTVGSGGIKVVTSNPISISTPMKNFNPTGVKSIGGGTGLLASGLNLLGALFGSGRPGP